MSEIYKMKVFLVGLIVLISMNTKAQILVEHCGTSNVMHELYNARPNSKIEAEESNNFAKNFFALKTSKAAPGEYIIPVVFHVYGNAFNDKTIDDDIIKAALQKTNEDFQGITADWNDIIPEFDEVKMALNITFKLAQIDPNGNSTTGIIYYPKSAGYGNGNGNDAQIQQDAWDNYKYMNVYIQNDLYNDGTTNNSGVAWYPDTWMSDNKLSRVVYNGAYLGSNTDENFRSVLTHEFGHWLNLIHTFEGGCPDTESCNVSGDLICDTPPADEANMNGELNCQGVISNWENFMDYSNNYSMFTVEQVARMEAALQHPTRLPLWQDTNLDATGVNGELGPRLIISSTGFRESYLNDGSIENELSISTIDGAEFAVIGELTEGTHFTNLNLPAGLEIKINVVSADYATLSITGKADSHTNDVANISITFLDASIVGGGENILTAEIKALYIDFLPAYEIIHKDITDITVNSSTTWNYFEIDNGNAFGIWYNNGNLRFETYKKSMICESGSRNITLIPFNEEINSSRNWVEGGDYPDEHDLRTSGYKAWDGETAYMGFQFISNGHPCYGWFKVTVSSNGNTYTLHEYAYNQEPYGSIAAGTQNYNGNLTNFTDFTNENKGRVKIYPNPATETINISLNNNGNSALFQLFSLDGKLIKELILKKSLNSINISSIKKGIYFLKLKYGTITNIQKIVLN